MTGATHPIGGRSGGDPRRRRVRTDPVRITTAGVSPARDLAIRERRYLISMGIRVVCFVGAVFIGGWLRWVLVAGALILPYVAVVMANAAAPLMDATDLPEGPSEHKELE